MLKNDLQQTILYFHWWQWKCCCTIKH